MSKKRKNAPAEKEQEPLGENWTNPFANLNIKIEEPPPPPPPPPPSKEELARRALSLEDQELLKAFEGDSQEAPAELARTDHSKKLERIVLSKERKGRGGKTVTIVRGLENMDTMKQMELCATIKSALGIGGRFVDGILELQGEVIDRAGDWFRKNGYQVK